MGIVVDNLPLWGALGGYYHANGGLVPSRASLSEKNLTEIVLWAAAGYVGGAVLKELVYAYVPQISSFRTSLGVSDIGVATGRQFSGSYIF